MNLARIWTVELGKQATFGLMGRAGYSEHLDSVNGALGGVRKMV